METIQTALIFSRNTKDQETSTITITVRDVSSRINFLKLKVKNDDFINAIFGLGEVKSFAEVDGLENVGKTRQQEPFSIRVPCRAFDDKKGYEHDLIDHCPDGWFVHLYLSAKDSIVQDGDNMVKLNTYIYRYV